MISNNLKKSILIVFLIQSIASNAQLDSIVSYDFNNQKEEIVTVNRTAEKKAIKPFFGIYQPVDLSKYNSKIKTINSDISPLMRTRDIFGGFDQYPISTVVKLIKLVNNKEVGTCTGTLVNGGFLMTAAHCIKTDEDKYPDKIVVLPMYDHDSIAFEKDTVYIEKVYYKKGYNKFGGPKEVEECMDLGLYKLSKKIGDKLGYIGMDVNLDLSPFKKKYIYNFSYPNQSFAPKFISLKESYKDDKELVKKLDVLIKKITLFTPDFNKTNQYYRYGNIHEIKKSTYFKYNIDYSIAGESGSSWINSKYYLMGIVSAQIESKVWACNNRDLLKAYIEIILQNGKQ